MQPRMTVSSCGNKDCDQNARMHRLMLGAHVRRYIMFCYVAAYMANNMIGIGLWFYKHASASKSVPSNSSPTTPASLFLTNTQLIHFTVCYVNTPNNFHYLVIANHQYHSTVNHRYNDRILFRKMLQLV